MATLPELAAPQQEAAFATIATPPPVSEERGPSQQQENIFKTNVREYLAIHDDISKRIRDISLLRKKKTQLRDYILYFMKTNSVDQCVSENAKLYIAQTKSTQAINRDYVQSVLSMNMDLDSAERLVDSLWSKREVTVKDTLRQRRTVPRAVPS
jgi:hypothetical protein